MKFDVIYCSNYNGCNIQGTIDGRVVDEYDNTYGKRIEAVQTKIINKAYEDVIKSGRHEGEYNGDIDDLEEFAIKVVKDEFGTDVTVKFEEDSSST